MKVKLDENLPESLMSPLAALSHDVLGRPGWTIRSGYLAGRASQRALEIQPESSNARNLLQMLGR